MIDVDVLVVGSGGAGAQGGLLGGGAYVSGPYHNATTYYASGGHNGGNAGYSGMVVSGQTKIMSSSTYSITIAPGAIYDPAGNAAGIGTNGSPSYINGPFPDSVSSSMVKNFTNNVVGSTVVVGGFPGVINAAGGLGGIGQGGGSLLSHAFPPAYLGRTTTSTVFASNISGTNSYYGNGNTGGGLSGGGPATAAAGANATNYGPGGGGGYGGVYYYSSNGYYMSTGGLGGNSGAGISIIRCRQSDFVSYTMAGGAATTTTSNGIVYSIFTFTTSGIITFHST